MSGLGLNPGSRDLQNAKVSYQEAMWGLGANAKELLSAKPREIF